MPEKVCPRCGGSKPVEAFSKNRNRPDGLQAYCKACSNAANAAVLARNASRSEVPTPDDKRCGTCGTVKPSGEFYRDKRRSDGLYASCKGCHLATASKWGKANRPKTRAAVRRSYARHADKRRAAARDWYHLNRPTIAARKAEDKRRKRAYYTAQEQGRRARKLNAPGTCSPEQIAARWAYYGGLCWMCGGLATDIEHVKPLIAGGAHWPANLRPACGPCNSAKGGRWPLGNLPALVAERTARVAA